MPYIGVGSHLDPRRENAVDRTELAIDDNIFEGDFVDDLAWNQWLEQNLGETVMPPAAVAQAWAEQQQQAEYQRDLEFYEEQWQRLDDLSRPPLEHHPGLHNDAETSLHVQWKATVESNPKKAASWRKKRTIGSLFKLSSAEEPTLIADATENTQQQRHEEPATVTLQMLQHNARGREAKSTRASRKKKTMAIYTMNTSGRVAALEAMQFLSKKSLSIAAIAIQEHHVLLEGLPDFQHRIEIAGWRVSATPGVIKEERPSAGVAVVVPRHVPSGTIQVLPADISPDASPGRLTALWVQAALPGGILVMSAYLWNSEGLTTRNRELITAALASAKSHGGPWILLADFNNTPESMHDGLGAVLAAAGAVIFSPKSPTFYPGPDMQPNLIDFCILDARIAHAGVVKSIKVDEEISIGKHRAVKVELSNKGMDQYCTKLVKVRAFPKHKPIGCARAPVVPVADSRSSLDDKFAEVLSCAEAEIARLCDLVNPDGTVDSRYAGRKHGFKSIKALPLPPRTAGPLGEASKTAYKAKWLAERLQELASHSASTRRGDISLAAVRQRLGIQNRLSTLLKDKDEITRLTKLDQRWPEWIFQAAQWEPSDGNALLAEPIAAAKMQALTLAQKHAKDAKGRWIAWVREKVQEGGGSLHAFTRRAYNKAVVVHEAFGQLDATPGATLQREQSLWKQVWTKLEGQASAPWKDWKPQPEDALEPISPASIRVAAKTFKVHTALGVDQLHPRALLWLSDETLQGLAETLNVIEQSGSWPQAASTSLIHLIPKTVAGTRPIGLLPTVVRIYERIRRPVVARWRESNAKQYNWMTGGRSAVRAVWAQTVQDEAAVAQGKVSVSALLDLEKAFECVRLDRIWGLARKRNFPMIILKAVMEAYCFARRLVYQGAVGEEIRTLSAILAGGGFATDLLSLLLEEQIDEMLVLFPTIMVYMVVDDVKLGVIDQTGPAVSTLVAATAHCINRFENLLGMKVSRGRKWFVPSNVKSVALGSTHLARRRLTTSMKALGIPVVKHTKNLGVDYAPGTLARRRLVLASRWKKVKNKGKRARKLGKFGGTLVARTGLLPALCYGTSSTGMPATILAQFRTLVAGTAGPMRGRSATARLAMLNCDPAFTIVLAPLRAWWTAVWDDMLPLEVMEKAFFAAKVRMSNHEDPQQAVIGGASAYLASVAKLGWVATSINSVIVDGSTQLQLGENADPKMLIRLAVEALTRSLAVQSSVVEDLTSLHVPNGYHRASSAASGHVPIGTLPGLLEQAQAHWWENFVHVEGKLVPWFRPAQDAYRAAKKRGVSQSALFSFVSLIEGGWWPQARLHYYNVGTDPLCKCCGIQIGTLWHRVACPCEDGAKTSELPLAVRIGTQRWWDPLYSRAVPAMPLAPLCVSGVVRCFPDTAQARSTPVTGEVFTDGALRGAFREIRRAGWAFAMLGSQPGTIAAVHYGVITDAYPTVLRTELTAILEALRLAIEPIAIYSDSGQAVDGFARGQRWCCSSRRDGADVWRKIWDQVAEVGEVRVLKVKAHTTVDDVKEGRISEHLQSGNAAADHFAVLARCLAEQLSPTRLWCKHYARARQWYQHVLEYIPNWKQDAEAATEEDLQTLQMLPGDVEQEPFNHFEDEQEENRLNLLVPQHVIWKLGSSYLCQRCGKRFGPSAKVNKVSRGMCKGTPQVQLYLRSGLITNSKDTWAFSDNNLRRRGATRLKQSTPPDEGVHGLNSRRRIVGKRRPPELLEDTPILSLRDERTGHSLRSKGSVCWCDDCGRWSIDRLGKALKAKCSGSVDARAGSYRVRLARLRAGLHPLTMQQL